MLYEVITAEDALVVDNSDLDESETLRIVLDAVHRVV